MDHEAAILTHKKIIKGLKSDLNYLESHDHELYETDEKGLKAHARRIRRDVAETKANIMMQRKR